MPQDPEPKVTSTVDALDKGLADLAAKHEKAVADLKSYVEKQVEEIKNAGQPQADTQKVIAEIRDEIKSISLDMARHKPSNPEEQPSLSQMITGSDAWKSVVEKYQAGVLSTGRIIIKGSLFDLMERKTTIDSSAVGSSTPGILVPDRVTGIIPAARRRLYIRDVLPRGATTANAVEYPQENAFTNAASPQTESSAKAESALTFTISSAPVVTIAHWIPASRQVLDDWTQLQRYIETTLLYGLKLKEETELLSGDGLGSHISGLTKSSTAYAGTYAAGSDTALDTLRHAKLELEVANEMPDFLVMNPVNNHNVELIKTDVGGANTGQYILGDPRTGNGPATIWGMNNVVSNSMTSGKFLVGASMMAQIFDRMEARIDISTEHSTYFTQNLIAIRAEERLALAIYRVGAFRYGSF